MEFNITDKRSIKIDWRLSPIFILGMRKRCGTNFLYDLLCLHNNCTRNNISEDYFLTNINLIADYVESLYKKWHPKTKVRIASREELYKCLGYGLLHFLELNSLQLPNNNDLQSKRCVTKTPSVKNLECFFLIFPQANLLIIIRDGRAVVESNVKTFNTSYDEEIYKWKEAANAILQFQKEIVDSNTANRHLIVRYEDLFLHTEQEIKKIFNFLDLNLIDYDLKTASNLPVRGSSEWMNIKSGMDWKPREKPSNFNPLLRFSHWDKKLHRKFNLIAGDYLEELGYTKKYP